MSLLPHASQAHALRSDLDVWRGALELLRARHGLSGTPVPFAAGSLPVFGFDDVVVKLYPPNERRDFEVESAVLSRIAGRLPLPTPTPIAEGELDGWAYLVMTRLSGRPLEEVLGQATPTARLDAMAELGVAVDALHRIGVGGLPSHVPDFEAFLSDQVRGKAARERERGCAPEWVAAHERFVSEVPRGSSRPVLLHTELGPGHVLAEHTGGSIVLTGCIDFVDAMVGDAEYDFAAVAFFIARGDSAAMGAFLHGYGWDGDWGEVFGRRVMRYLLLHRFAPASWLLTQIPPGDARDFEDLVPLWVGLP